MAFLMVALLIIAGLGPGDGERKRLLGYVLTLSMLYRRKGSARSFNLNCFRIMDAHWNIVCFPVSQL